jgi:hypothetical protein
VIKITIVEGPHMGRARSIENGMYNGIQFEPLALLLQIADIGSKWKIDFAGASEEERFEWARADFVVRITRALIEGRPISFMGKTYMPTRAGDIDRVGSELDDAISLCGLHVSIMRDDEQGVVIATGEREFPLQ